MDSAKYALSAKFSEGIDIPLLKPGWMFRLNEIQFRSNVKIKPHWHRHRHLKGVARLEKKLTSTWTTRNLGHVNNKKGKSQ